ncbi:MAG TPA: hypothetical protein PKA88_23620, partial [Polyangiaceae bacterium]|nr:hypothetical protein [Polyangiaceae bacterium]
MRSLFVGFPGALFLVAFGACSSGSGGGAASCADGGVCPSGTVCNPSTSLCETGATGGSGGGGNVGGTGAVGNNGGVGNTAGAGNSGALGGGAGAGASAGVGGGGPCVPGNCPGYTLGGLVPMNGCCPTSGTGCGGEIDASISGLVNVPEGCYPLN